MSVADTLKDSIMAAASVGSELKSMADDLLKKTMKGEDVSGELGPLEDAISKVETAQHTLDTLKSSVDSANATVPVGLIVALDAAVAVSSAVFATTGLKSTEFLKSILVPSTGDV